MNSQKDKIIKASFRECPLSDRKLFGQSHCLLTISVGQPVHEGDKFLATVKLLNTSFKRVTILVDDTVQWHAYKITHPTSSDQELYHLALHEGDRWLSRNIATINKLAIPFDIMRWDHWRRHPNFQAQLAKVEQLYATDGNYKTAIDSNIQEYLDRFLKRHLAEDFNFEHAFSCCLNYLKEECAVMTLWAEASYDFEVYPAGRSKAMAATYEYLIKPFHPTVLKSVALRFKKYQSRLTAPFEVTTLVPPILQQSLLEDIAA